MRKWIAMKNNEDNLPSEAGAARVRAKSRTLKTINSAWVACIFSNLLDELRLKLGGSVE
jgi:hypothetical protein